MSASKPTRPEPVSSRGRQVKVSKGQNMLSAGIRRLRTLSGAYPDRSNSDAACEQPPLVPVLVRGSSDQNQTPWNSPSGTHPERLPSTVPPVIDSGPLPPSLAQLRGIHYVHDAKQDPDLDKASSTTQSRPQSSRSDVSSGAFALDDITNSSSNQNPSFAITGSEPRDDDSLFSPNSLSTFDDTSTSTNDGSSVISGIMNFISPITKMPQLSPRACQAAYPPIDLQSPYAPYAPTSPLSASSVRTTNSSAQNHHRAASTFNKRMGLRHLPSIVHKPLAKHHAQTHPTTIQQQIAHSPSAFDIHIEQPDSKTKICSPRLVNDSNGSHLTCPLPTNSSDQSSRVPAELSHCRSGDVTPTAEAATPRSGAFMGKLGWSGKSKRRHRRNVSANRSSNIPFPCSTQDDSVISSQKGHERNRSESANSQRSKIWVLPIERLRTSSSISTLIRSVRSTLRHSPSQVSFETRACSDRTESFYEILDASAIPSCDGSSIPK